MKILVTGAGGYIGRHVVLQLAQSGATVVAVDVHDFSVPEGVLPLVGDVLNDIEFVMSIPPVDVCLHLAWQDGFKHNAPSHLQLLWAHVCFLMEMVRKGVQRLAVMGSMHEVGYWEGEISESTPCMPLSLYGIAKNALRQALICMLKDKDVHLQWLRGYYIYGDDWNNHSVFTKILEFAREGRRDFPFTSGRNLYDFVEIDDLAKMICATILQEHTNGVIECCSGTPKSLAEVAENFIMVRGLDIHLHYGAYPDRPYDSPGVWGNPTKIREILANWSRR